MHDDSCIGINYVYAHTHVLPKCFKSFHTLLGFVLCFVSSSEFWLAVVIGTLFLRTILCLTISRFSVMARFKTAVVGSLLLLWEEHEDESDTRCMVSELEEAVFSLLSTSSAKSKSSRHPLFIHPSISLFALHSLCSVWDRCHQCQHARFWCVLSQMVEKLRP